MYANVVLQPRQPNTPRTGFKTLFVNKSCILPSLITTKKGLVLTPHTADVLAYVFRPAKPSTFLPPRAPALILHP